MKKVINLFLVLALYSVSTSCLETNSSNVKLITADEMQSILEQEDVQLIDVRTEEEFEAFHIVDAQNIDIDSPTFDDDISNLDKEKPVIVYCKGGVRSAKCAKKMEDAGFKKIYDLEGGLSRWKHSDKLELEVKS
ncbi:rhodanese-like domain-containing protein [Winogradskyella alexanderae]|uniref:Rhodanese-like domain-containing protein n=1 Tax=Winogradskyella alexanderae TaxID=2877123 RepID=A0ABS7XTT4_9FLAO|nr:rhodanese-like domain-containing protein [Winogradskyella alexanderae]MCA0132884.1 rhodanese-like domain-containing protein [Winogradskyella alexanderae]